MISTMKIAAATCILLGSCASAFAPTKQGPRIVTTEFSESKADLQEMANKLNPKIGYFDPLNLAQGSFWGTPNEFTIGFLRHSEIKHGRVAMAAFVGYCVQSNVHFPWKMTLSGEGFPSTDLSPPEQWDALPFAAKVQIILFIGFLEVYSELSPTLGELGMGKENVGIQHYCRGGVPGKYPTFDAIPHHVPFNLYDPFERNKDMTPEEKERGLLVEINNGRLAMLGIFGFLCAQTIPGSVPFLGFLPPYPGEVMAPFEVV